MFRDALEIVRNHVLRPERKPAFSLPSAPARKVTPKDGPSEGVDGDLWSIAEALRDGSLTVEGLIESARRRIESYDQRLGAFEYVADVRQEAETLAAEAASSSWRGLLHGIPISVKDIIDVAGMPTTGSSKALPARLAHKDSTAVARLKAAGALIMGKTVTHEFALGVTTPQSRNPWDESRVPGGSSGGSAISIVTGMSAASLGTDTRASIRVPAALCGLVGFRPTTGLVPIDRWLPLSWSMDVLAPMARSVRDVALLMDVLTDQPGGYTGGLPGSLTDLRIAYANPFSSGTEAGVLSCFESALGGASNAGARVSEQTGPSDYLLQLSNMTGMVVSRVEAAHAHHEAGTNLAACTPEVRDQLSEAMLVSGTDYVRCLRIREELYERFLALFENADLLLMPTSKVVAPPRKEAERYLLVLSENCIHWSLVGFPAISLFCGLSDGLPVGVQMVAPPGQDAFLLSAAHALERLLPPAPTWSP
ncbi:MAG TPA: amidase [Dehalococcoidia bacterium]|nr:amidase [Dehalococcoidia bacterium]